MACRKPETRHRGGTNRGQWRRKGRAQSECLVASSGVQSLPSKFQTNSEESFTTENTEHAEFPILLRALRASVVKTNASEGRTTKAIYTSLLRRFHHELLRRLQTNQPPRAALRGVARASQAPGRRSAAARRRTTRAGGMGAKAGEAVVARGSQGDCRARAGHPDL